VVRFLALAPVALLLAGLFTVWAGPLAAPAAAASGDWAQFHNDAAHQGYNTQEHVLAASNVSTLATKWTGTTSGVFSSPVVADGVVYVGSTDGRLYAYAVGCNAGGGSCSPLWTAQLGNTVGVPAVAGGVVYVGSSAGTLGSSAGTLSAYAVGCNTGGGSCSPLWTAQLGGSSGTFAGAPVVADGVVYVGFDYEIFAFAVGCNSGGGTCVDLWAGATGSYVESPPSVADGVVYVASADHKLYAYSVGCTGFCQPLWTATTGGYLTSSPVVANGVVYVGSADHSLYAYAVGCASGGGSCTPLWRADTGAGVESSPAVADGVVYVPSLAGHLFAYAVGCNSGGGTCTPLWTATTYSYDTSSPAVANGVVYVGDGGNDLLAFAVGCNSGGGTCSPLWTATTGGLVRSSPAIANGVVYVTSGDHKLYAFGLPAPATYHAITPTRVLDTRNGTGGLSGPFTNHAARTFTVSGVPAGAIAVTGNLTVTGQTSSGYLFIGPVATNNPGSSTLNFPVGDDRANAVTVALGAGGTLSITFVAPSNGPTAHAIFDVTGYFTPDASGATYHALSPTRALDTRNGTGGLSGPFTNHAARTFTVTGGTSGLPAGATAVTGNLTVTGQTSSGYLFIGPVATNNPGSSTLNFPAGDDRANAVTVALGAGGTLSITFVAPSNGPTAHAIFDVTGYFTADMTGATYHALSPTRALDTRNGTGGLSGPFTNHAARAFTVSGGSSGVPANAIAVTGNLTVTGQTSSGYLFIGPVATNNPGSSTLNFPIGDDRANAVTVALSGTGTLSITFVAPSNGPTAHAIFDVTGFFTP
jgi:outer membrane protein assembly factor BamB